MTRFGWFCAIFFVVAIAFAWIYYFREDIQQWWRERGPRRRMIAEEQAARRQEMERLREELANKYLTPPKPPATPR